MRTKERVRVKQIETLSADWYILRKTTFDYLRNNGEWQSQARETYDRGNGATILLYHPHQRTVILTRQFRYPAFVNGYAELMIEAPAGLLDESSPEERIKAETEEETGYVVHDVRKIFEAYMSPGSVTEKLYFFVAAYDPASRPGRGGGVQTEGEDIEVLELPFDQAFAMIEQGTIVDAKTIMLLQYAKLYLFVQENSGEQGQ